MMLGGLGVAMYHKYGNDMKRMYNKMIKTAKNETKQAINQINKNL